MMQYVLAPDLVVHGARASSERGELEVALSELLAAGARVPTLELIGPANRDHLLALGDWAIDGMQRKTRAWFRGLAETDVPARLGIERVRLIGCRTASGPRARRSNAELAHILGVPVIGTLELVRVVAGAAVTCALTGTRSLDLDALPARCDGREPMATPAQARALLAAVQRNAGTELPGLLATPHTAVALPSGHRVEVLLDDELVRIGELVFPVADPRALRAAMSS
jgi:hypothetical protein